MSKPDLIADMDAAVVKRVHGFAAVSDVRYYLCGVHVVPGSKLADKDGKPVRIEATNGHMVYVEEDLSGVVERELIVQLSKRSHVLLRQGNRVKVYADNAVHITDSHGQTLYIEPGVGVVNAQFPSISHLVGVPTDWHEGLRATVNSRYLLAALNMPGFVRFFSRKDADGQFSMKSAVMFVLDGGSANGGKAMGLIMPVRGQNGESNNVADMLPLSLVPARGAQQEAA